MKKNGKVMVFSAAMIASTGLTGCAKAPAEVASELYNVIASRLEDLKQLQNNKENPNPGPQIIDYEPNDNVEEDIYGPPDFWDDYDGEDNIEETVYGPPDFYDDYDPVENVEGVLYASPDFFD